MTKYVTGYREQGLEKIVVVWLWAVFELAPEFCYSDLTVTFHL